MPEGDCHPTDIRAHHIDRAMREVDEVAHAKDQRQPNRRQRLDIANDQTIYGLVKEGAKEALHDD
jgi:hypothetical protein